MCDSTIPGRDEGRLDAETLDRVDTRLAGLPRDPPAADRLPSAAGRAPPPPARLGNAENPERPAALLGAHPQVVAVLTGHAHTAAASVFAARPLIVGPAVTWTLRTPWEGDLSADRDQPPGLAVHVPGDGRRLTTYRVVF